MTNNYVLHIRKLKRASFDGIGERAGNASFEEVTINGIGERAGNASFEEGNDLLGGLYSGINTKHIASTSKMVEEYTGLFLQPHKTIVGANAFAHGSGIHQHGVLKHKATYEFVSPEDIGLVRSNERGIVLGKLSGRHALKSRLLELGHEIDENKFDDVFRRFKAVAERKKNFTDDDLELLVSDESYQPSVARKLVALQFPAMAATKGTNGVATTHVTASRESNSILVLTERVPKMAPSITIPVHHVTEVPKPLSDELIEMIFRSVLVPGDRILDCPPTFPVYAHQAAVSGALLVKVPRKKSDYGLDVPLIEKMVDKVRPKCIFLASPNNPEGSIVTDEVLLKILDMHVLVVLDEAYIKF
ncbi:hypothetical protein RJ639_004898 [Escallonia herrerae]|uniref:Uncharacterized protein n=1 Tax=Escallonia herrerae TaxID=1293975 RepID=A0AA88W3Y6_9ASTE|nr:hypothetical protein RJ639_004898 [Escallonia herrerae]